MKKRWLCGALALCLALSLASCGKKEPDATGETATSGHTGEPPVSYDTGALQNVYYKLVTEKKLNVAYMGGSITVGEYASHRGTTSYRALTTAWLRQQFPEAEITETNAACSGTGIAYAAYRALSELRLRDEAGRPDLVFVEEAINTKQEKTAPEEILMYTESLVRTIYAYAPEAQIIFLYTTDIDEGGTEYEAMRQMNAVTEAYGIPTLSIGAMLFADMIAENGGVYPEGESELYLHYFHDYCHPEDPGYAEYASYVTAYLAEELVEKNLDPEKHEVSYLPGEPLWSASLTAPHMETFLGQSLGENSHDFKLGGDGSVTSDVIGATLTFTFTGTNLKVWANLTDDGGALQISVDSGGTLYLPFREKYGGFRVYTLAENLEPGEHTMTLTVKSTKFGSKVDLYGFFIDGDEACSPLVLQ